MLRCLLLQVPTSEFRKEELAPLWKNGAQQCPTGGARVLSHPARPGPGFGEGIHPEPCKHQGQTSSFHKLLRSPPRSYKAETVANSPRRRLRSQGSPGVSLLGGQGGSSLKPYLINPVGSVFQAHSPPQEGPLGNVVFSSLMMLGSLKVAAAAPTYALGCGSTQHTHHAWELLCICRAK